MPDERVGSDDWFGINLKLLRHITVIEDDTKHLALPTCVEDRHDVAHCATLRREEYDIITIGAHAGVDICRYTVLVS